MNRVALSIVVWALGSFLSFGLSPLPNALAQPMEGRDYFHAEDRKVPLTVHLGQLGVVAKDGVSIKRVETALARFKLKLRKVYPQQILVFTLPKALPRTHLFKLARRVREEAGELIAYAGFTATPNRAKFPLIVTDELIVKVKGENRDKMSSLNQEFGTELISADRFVKDQYLLRVRSDAPMDALQVANHLHESGQVEFAHPNFVRVIDYRQFIPNDTLFGNQWHHQNTGQGGGTPDADVDTPFAWNITQGAAGTVIAVIDDGFDLAHADLALNLWVNAGEIAGNNLDDDANGFVDDLNGFDFRGNDGNPSPGATDNHGTAVVGVAAARGNNNLGVAGACPNCSVMMIRQGVTFQDDANAFGYAQQMGATIITNSWGYSTTTPIPTAVANAINAVSTNGRGGLGSVVLFAMNNGNRDDCVGSTPDISSLANVIAVSAASNQDRKVTESAFGNCMDVLAPTHRGYGGGTPFSGTLNITTTDRTGNAGYNSTNPIGAACPTVEAGPPPANARDYSACFGGTSSATPLTAGSAGLVLTVNGGLTRLQVQQLLQDTTDRIQDSAGSYATDTGFSTPAGGVARHGWGRINAFEAVRVAAPASQGGRDGVDVFIRDNRLDWGNSEQPSNVLFEPARGFIPHYTSVDIKVDAPPFQTAPVTSDDFETLVDEKPKAGQLNRVYVRVRNRGPNTANSVTIKLHWADAGPGLPALPGDFWSAWPGDPSSTGVWHPMPCTANSTSTACTLTGLAYSGASIAGCPGRTQPACQGGNDVAQIVAFDFQGPTVGTSGVNHFCLFAVLDSSQDRAGPLTRTPTANDFIPDWLTPVDNNVTHRNIQVEDSARSTRFEERFYIRNAFDRPARVRLNVIAPKGWDVSMDKREFNKVFPLEAKQEILVKMTIKTPKVGVTGRVSVRQDTTLGRDTVIGGIDYHFR